MHADDYPDDELDEKGVTVVGAIGTHDRFSYEYDFADGWAHEVVVETLRKIPRAPATKTTTSSRSGSVAALTRRPSISLP
jgi:hypothetical protein